MNKLKVLLVKFGTEGLAALVVLLFLVSSLSNLLTMTSEPRSVSQSKEVLEKAARANNPAPVIPLDNYFGHFKRFLEWGVRDEALLRNPHFKYEPLAINKAQKIYDKLLSEHEPLLQPLAKSAGGGLHDIFPGSNVYIAPLTEYIGACGNLHALRTTPLSIRLQWKDPVDVRKAQPDYCQLQRRRVIFSTEAGMEDKKLVSDWDFIQGQDKKIASILGFEAGANNAKQDAQSANAAPAQPMLPGFQLASDNQAGENTNTESKEEKKLSAIGNRIYTYEDSNLDPGSLFEYRVRAVGPHTEDSRKVVLGEWTEPVLLQTQKDPGLRFVAYTPGQIQNGKRISPDRVGVMVSLLVDEAPWNGQKVFVSEKFTGVEVGSKNGFDRVGAKKSRVEARWLDELVLLDSQNLTYYFLGDKYGSTAQQLEQKKTQRNIAPFFFRNMDFTTPWLAKEVKVETAENTFVRREMDANTGRIEEVKDVVVEYNYILILEDKDNPEKTLEVELERSDRTIKLHFQ